MTDTKCKATRDNYVPEPNGSILETGRCGESLYATRETVKVGVGRSFTKVVWNHNNSGHQHSAKV
tara:strand:- start:798 stop:992 length:195 start_codon:yes stop_codon:yes gene_type:complete